ncbi:MAG TPA: hypothetical protein PLR40_15860 [Microthrixaceae bacterium]|nr:hypothetical protein [Microthrixaceae bacterium]
MGVDALNELNDYVYFRAGQPTVIWTGLGLLRDARGRWTVHEWEEVDHPTVGRYMRHPKRPTTGYPRQATPDEIEWLPVCRDNLREPTEQCARCGQIAYLDEHHWAPKHFFDDHDSWPTSRLCRSCHMEWHNVVTPNMGRPIK